MHRPRGWSRRVDTALWCAVPTGLLVLFIVIPLVALVWRAVIDPTLWSGHSQTYCPPAPMGDRAHDGCHVADCAHRGYPAGLPPGTPSFPGQVARRNRHGLATRAPARGGRCGVAHGLWPSRGVLGPPLAVLGIELPFTMTAVILAQLFVAGSFYIRGAKLGFAAVDRNWRKLRQWMGPRPGGASGT